MREPTAAAEEETDRVAGCVSMRRLIDAECTEYVGFCVRATSLRVFPGTYRANADRDFSQWDLEIASTHPPTAS